MREIIKDIWNDSVDLWKNNRKEFWEVWLGGIFVFCVFIFTLLVVIPVFS